MASTRFLSSDKFVALLWQSGVGPERHAKGDWQKEKKKERKRKLPLTVRKKNFFSSTRRKKRKDVLQAFLAFFFLSSFPWAQEKKREGGKADFLLLFLSSYPHPTFPTFHFILKAVGGEGESVFLDFFPAKMEEGGGGRRGSWKGISFSLFSLAVLPSGPLSLSLSSSPI